MNILITGGTGTMGSETINALLNDEHDFKLFVFSLPSKTDKKMLKRYGNKIEVIYGDLRDYKNCRDAIVDMDIVLHIGALVSPEADKNPQLAWDVNFGGTKNLIDAIVECNQQYRTKFVYIGTVAQTGNRQAPYHYGRIGDPIIPSVFDYYAISKTAAEKYVVESPLSYWVSLRQTGILSKDLFVNQNSGIETHQPLDNHLEWVSAKDSATLMLNICKSNKNNFWRDIYNIGGGESYRYVAHDFIDSMMKMLINKGFDELYDKEMYATRNFHGQYYLDSNILDDMFNFRRQSIEEMFDEIKSNQSFLSKIGKYLPSDMIRKNIKAKLDENKNTPSYWRKNNESQKLKAYFGNNQERNYSDSDDFCIVDNGYDTELNVNELTFEDLKSISSFRGGKLISNHYSSKDLFMPIQWECSEKHRFSASPFLVVKGGHWCHKCLLDGWNFDKIAKSNKHISQVWYADHNKNESNYYKNEYNFVYPELDLKEL